MAKKGSILLNLAGIGPALLHKIIENIFDIDQIFKLKDFELSALPFLNSKDCEKILSLRNSKILNNELKEIEKNNVKVIDLFDAAYPYLLKQISHPPLVLYAKGDLNLLERPLIAVVGTRTPTRYGKETAYNFSYKLSSLKITVVSGLALGIDTAAHQGALQAEGSTVAILGSGLNCIYPRQNKELATQIAERGLLLSEYPLDTKPLACNFPRRNRIISGLSVGVIVVEAAQKSGALITANYALSQNREVFAVPGRINDFQGKGPNSLIKEGAKLVDSIEDVLEELNFEDMVEIKERYKIQETIIKQDTITKFK